MANVKGYVIKGIKKAPSKNGERVYTTYFCERPFSDYELDNTEVTGIAVEEVQTTEDFPIGIGDEVIFYYGKAIGNWQPVTDFKMLNKASVIK